MTISPTRSQSKQQESEDIERQTQQFLEQGGEIKRERIRTTRQVDLTWRNYADTAMEDEHETN